MQTLDQADPGIIVYPASDGKPMADNTKQAWWILHLYGNLDTLFADRADVFVAANNLWYPVEGAPEVRAAPDVYVVFGREKKHRGSYQQWKEGGVPLTVVFEILSPGNDQDEMTAKHHFYEDHGVEEYYVYDPDSALLTIWTRGPHGAALAARAPRTFVSPRMGIRFDTNGEEFVVRYPDGQPFQTLSQERTQRIEAELRAARADAEREVLAAERDAAATERDAAAAQLTDTRGRLRRLRDLGRLAREGTATPAELAELKGLEDAINGS